MLNVWPSSGLKNETCHFLLRFYRYLIASLVINEALSVVWKLSVSCLEGYHTHADTVTLYHDLVYLFQSSAWSVTTCLTIYNTHNHRLTQWNHTVLKPAALQIYSDAVTAKGATLHNCFGFIDGTVRPICRPGTNQRVLYNGHKRVHALKFQCVALPNGLIGNMYGPVGERC